MINIVIVNGPSLTATWFQGMNAQQALEEAYNSINPNQVFTYGLQYYGSLGYLVFMINETYDSFPSLSNYIPFYFWEFLLNGQPAAQGIDQTFLNDGDTISFSFISYNTSLPAQSTLHQKYSIKNIG